MLGRRSKRSLHRSWPVVTIALCAAGQMATPAWAWGRVGHRVTARIAEKHVNPKAKAAVAALLGDGESIADASTWADEQKRRIKGSAPWHYVDVPLDQEWYDSRFSGPGAEKGCIVDKIHDMRIEEHRTASMLPGCVGRRD